MFRFATPRPSRKPSLTPLIDVVFLLLVFFMLAARFGQDLALPLQTAGQAAPYQGPPRLVEITATGPRLNGTPTDAAVLPDRLARLMQTAADTVILRPDETATVQQLVDVIDILRSAGLTHLVVVEAQP